MATQEHKAVDTCGCHYIIWQETPYFKHCVKKEFFLSILNLLPISFIGYPQVLDFG